MKEKKKFDCVRMKHEIQQKLLKEMEGLSLEERRSRINERISADPVFGPIWRKAREPRFK